MPSPPARLHLSSPPKAGRTTFALQQAREEIRSGKRVIWGSEDMPDGVRFSQIFSDLDISSASRFHALNTGGEYQRALEEISRTARILPGVSLVVIDDWTPIKGRVKSDSLKAIEKLSAEIPENCDLIITSASHSDASGVKDLVVKGMKETEKLDFETWIISRESEDSKRTLNTTNSVHKLVLDEVGFIEA